MSSLTGSMHRVSARPSLIAVVLGVFIVASVFTEWALLGSKLHRLEIQYGHLEELMEAQQRFNKEQLTKEQSVESTLLSTSKSLQEDDVSQRAMTKVLEITVGETLDKASNALAGTVDFKDKLKQVSAQLLKLSGQQQLIDDLSKAAKSWEGKLEDVEATILSKQLDIDKITKLVNQHGEELQKLRKEVQAEHEALSSTLTQHQASVASLAQKQKTLESHVSTVVAVKGESDKAAAVATTPATSPQQSAKEASAGSGSGSQPSAMEAATASPKEAGRSYLELKQEDEEEEGGEENTLQETSQLLDDAADADSTADPEKAAKFTATASSPLNLTGTTGVNTTPAAASTLPRPSVTALSSALHATARASASPVDKADAIGSPAPARAAESGRDATTAAAEPARTAQGASAAVVADTTVGSQGGLQLQDDAGILHVRDASPKLERDDAGYHDIQEDDDVSTAAGEGLQVDGGGGDSLQDSEVAGKQQQGLKGAAAQSQVLQDEGKNAAAARVMALLDKDRDGSAVRDSQGVPAATLGASDKAVVLPGRVAGGRKKDAQAFSQSVSL